VAIVIESGRQCPEDVERILRALPEWFGIEESVLGYVDAARSLPTTCARDGEEIVGVCLVRRHNPRAAEIELLAVVRDRHREGIGRALVDHVRRQTGADGVELLQVKTFGPSGRSVEYERTRAFYEAMGFVPLEERTDIWGPDNPCLIMVLPL